MQQRTLHLCIECGCAGGMVGTPAHTETGGQLTGRVALLRWSRFPDLTILVSNTQLADSIACPGSGEPVLRSVLVQLPLQAWSGAS